MESLRVAPFEEKFTRSKSPVIAGAGVSGFAVNVQDSFTFSNVLQVKRDVISAFFMRAI
jgi:hypothetical protein